jgi:hypothetical protein
MAALADLGLAWPPKPVVSAKGTAGVLVPVQEDWAQTYEGYRLCYPHWRHATCAYSLLVKTLHGEERIAKSSLLSRQMSLSRRP